MFLNAQNSRSKLLQLFQNGSTKELFALVDTGAEVNLINSKLIPPELFNPNPKPIRLGVANSHLLMGGSKQAAMTLTFNGQDIDTGRNISLDIPLLAYDADVVCDLILSYGWLSQKNVILHPKRHGLLFTENPGPAWVPGAIKRQSKDISTFHTQPHQEDTQTVHPGNPEAASTFVIEQWEL